MGNWKMEKWKCEEYFPKNKVLPYPRARVNYANLVVLNSWGIARKRRTKTEGRSAAREAKKRLWLKLTKDSSRIAGSGIPFDRSILTG